jgi:hypothetical protein
MGERREGNKVRKGMGMRRKWVRDQKMKQIIPWYFRGPLKLAPVTVQEYYSKPFLYDGTKQISLQQ